MTKSSKANARCPRVPNPRRFIEDPQPSAGLGSAAEASYWYLVKMGEIGSEGQRDCVSLLVFAKNLEFGVQAEGRNENGSAVAVVARIVDVLQAGGYVNAAPDVRRVERLDDFLA